MISSVVQNLPPFRTWFMRCNAVATSASNGSTFFPMELYSATLRPIVSTSTAGSVAPAINEATSPGIVIRIIVVLSLHERRFRLAERDHYFKMTHPQ